MVIYWDLRGFLWDLPMENGDLLGFSMGLTRPGKRSQKRMGKIHHARNQWVNPLYFDWAMASMSQTVNVTTRGYVYGNL